MRALRLLCFAVTASSVPLAGCDAFSPAGGYCQAAAECDKELPIINLPIDGVGNSEDSIGVCVVNENARANALDANAEEECHKAAAAWRAYMSCVANAFAKDGDGCDALNDLYHFSDGSGPCENELDDYNDAVGEIDGNECTENET